MLGRTYRNLMHDLFHRPTAGSYGGHAKDGGYSGKPISRRALLRLGAGLGVAATAAVVGATVGNYWKGHLDSPIRVAPSAPNQPNYAQADPTGIPAVGATSGEYSGIDAAPKSTATATPAPAPVVLERHELTYPFPSGTPFVQEITDRSGFLIELSYEVPWGTKIIAPADGVVVSSRRSIVDGVEILSLIMDLYQSDPRGIRGRVPLRMYYQVNSTVPIPSKGEIKRGDQIGVAGEKLPSVNNPIPYGNVAMDFDTLSAKRIYPSREDAIKAVEDRAPRHFFEDLRSK